MTLRPIPPVAASVAALLTLAAGVAVAQPDSGAPTPPVTSQDLPPPSTDANTARQALQKKEGDVDQSTLLKETLTQTEKQYSLLRAGKLAVTYDLQYTYIGSQTLNANFDTFSHQLTQFELENVRSHTVTNSVEADYGILDNLTGTFSLPLVSKFTNTNTFTGLTNSFGDISLGARFQPFALGKSAPSYSLTGNLKLPTGRSPFTTVQGHDLATGQGYISATAGLNVSKVIDPVALFGSFNFTLADAANHIHFQNGAKTMTAIKPGPSLGFGGGFAYALSYDITTTVSFQESVSAPSHLVFSDGTKSNTTWQVSGVANIGFGVRVSPKTTLNIGLGIGLTTDSPDFVLDMNMPLNFGSLF